MQSMFPFKRWALSIEQAVAAPDMVPRWLFLAPLTIDADAFKTADGDLESSLRLICEQVHAQETGG